MSYAGLNGQSVRWHRVTAGPDGRVRLTRIFKPTDWVLAYGATLLFGHYVVTPVLFVFLVWVVLDLRRRLRGGLPFADVAQEPVMAPPPQGVATARDDG